MATDNASDTPVVIQDTRVTVVDIDMSMGAMVRFMVRWAIATIPAIIILAFFLAGLAVIFGGLLSGLV